MDGIVTHARNDAIAYPSHVRSMGAVIAPRRYRNMSRKPRGWNGNPKASECITIASDGTRAIFTPKRAKTTNVAGIKRKTASVGSRAQVDIALMSTMGTIHE